MSRSTGPILATGAVALFNETILAGKPVNWRIPVGTAVAAGGLALIERLSEELAVGVAWLALVTILFVRVTPGVKAPLENFADWWNAK
jgi:hypothetical protein